MASHIHTRLSAKETRDGYRSHTTYEVGAAMAKENCDATTRDSMYELLSECILDGRPAARNGLGRRAVGHEHEVRQCTSVRSDHAQAGGDYPSGQGSA